MTGTAAEMIIQSIFKKINPGINKMNPERRLLDRINPNPIFNPNSDQRIAFLLAGEVNDGFLSQIAMFHHALKRQIPMVKNARVIAYLGYDETHQSKEIPKRWRKAFKGIECRYFEASKSQKSGYYAQATNRFKFQDAESDIIIICDADILILGSLYEVFRPLQAGVPIVGTIAHLPPPDFANHLEHNQRWNELSSKITGQPLEFQFRYTLRENTPDNTVYAPFYLNHGLVAFRADALQEFSKIYEKIRDISSLELGKHPQFAGQVGLTMTQNTLNWKCVSLPLRYNFPNDERALEFHKFEGQNIHALHYLREKAFKRNSVLTSELEFNKFLTQELPPADRLVQNAFQAMTDGQYPF